MHVLEKLDVNSLKNWQQAGRGVISKQHTTIFEDIHQMSCTTPKGPLFNRRLCLLVKKLFSSPLLELWMWLSLVIKLNNAYFTHNLGPFRFTWEKTREGGLCYLHRRSTFSSVYIKKYPQYASTFFVDTPSLTADAENQNFYIFSLSPFYKKLQNQKLGGHRIRTFP